MISWPVGDGCALADGEALESVVLFLRPLLVPASDVLGGDWWSVAYHHFVFELFARFFAQSAHLYVDDLKFQVSGENHAPVHFFFSVFWWTKYGFTLFLELDDLSRESAKVHVILAVACNLANSFLEKLFVCWVPPFHEFECGLECGLICGDSYPGVFLEVLHKERTEIFISCHGVKPHHARPLGILVRRLGHIFGVNDAKGKQCDDEAEDEADDTIHGDPLWGVFVGNF